MSTLNLQQLLESDTISTIIDKINNNFNQIATNGGGPQGKPGEQGPPGLPGLKGPIGPAGDNGKDGKQVTLVADDPNWNLVYSPNIPVPGNANAAIAAGFNVGDIWIDNLNGVFYDIHETSPGVYDFQQHAISAAALSSSELWVKDTDSNINTNDDQQGIRNKNRFATFSLTSQILSTSTYIGESSSYSDLNTSWIGQNPDVLTYPRKAFKLSIDNAHTGDFVRIQALGTPIDFHYGRQSDKQSPLLYLGNSSPEHNDSNSFGFLIDTGINVNSSTGVINTVSILTLSSSGNGDQFFVDTYKLGTRREVYFRPQNDDDNVFVNFVDILPNGQRTAGNGNSFWTGISTMPDGTKLPYPGSDDHQMIMGIEQRLYHNSGSRAGKINFYTNQDGVHLSFVLSMTNTGAVTIGANHPSSTLSPNDDTESARLLVHAKQGINQNQLNANTAWFMPAQTYANTNYGTRMILGFQEYAGSSTSGDYISTISSEDAPNGTATPTPLVFQPNTGGNFNVSDFNTTTARVAVGEKNPKARFSVSGNMAVGNTNWTSSYTPPAYGMLLDQILGIGDSTPYQNLGHLLAKDLRLVLGTESTENNGKAYQIIYSQNNTSSAGIWLTNKTPDKWSWSIEKYLDHFIIGRDLTHSMRSLPSLAIDRHGRMSIGGTTASYLADTGSYPGYSDGVLLHLRNILPGESDTTDGIQTILRLETSSNSSRLKTYTSPAEPRDFPTPEKQYGPEIQFKSNFDGNQKTTTIKQGWADDNRTFLTPNGVGKGGHLMVFSDDTIDRNFTDDWQVRQNYAPTSISGNEYTLPFSVAAVTDISVKYKDDSPSGGLLSPSSLGAYAFEITRGANSSNTSGIVNYTYPSRLIFKRINERFVIVSFRIGLFFPSLTSNPSNIEDEIYYSNLFCFTFDSPIMDLNPHVQYVRSFEKPYVDPNEAKSYQDFLEGWWYTGACYSAKKFYKTNGTIGDGNQEAAPNLKANADSTTGLDYAMRPAPPLVRNFVSPYIPIPGSSMSMSWTITRFGNIMGGPMNKMNLWISLPQSIFLLSGFSSASTPKQVYFSGNAILDSYQFKDTNTSSSL